jgi:hypothetical protein
MPLRHCERSEAIHLSPGCPMDCFAPLAMTGMGRGRSRGGYRFAPPILQTPTGTIFGHDVADFLR